MAAEKDTRSKLRSECERHISSDTTVVLDTLNNIKGYRYELWCMARAAGSRCCVLWVQADVQACRERHARRPSNEVRRRPHRSRLSSPGCTLPYVPVGRRTVCRIRTQERSCDA